jgi:protein-tyrosine phosphatase
LFTRSAAPAHEIIPGIHLGRWPRAGDLELLRPAAVLDLTAEFSATPANGRFAYQNVPILDLTAPQPAALSSALEFIEGHRKFGPVYVHCALGLSRSAAVIAAWMLKSQQARRAEDALRRIAALRRGVTWTPAHVAAIESAVAPAAET